MFDDSTSSPAEGVALQNPPASSDGEQGRCTFWGRLVEARDVLAGVVAELAPDVVAAQDAPAVWGVFAEMEKLAGGGKLLMGPRVDDSGVAKEAGFRDTAEYLARRAGCSRSAASRQLRAAKKLGDRAETDAAVRTGTLSSEQASAITEAASADPSAERGLLLMAGRVSLKELHDACLRTKAAADPDPERTRRRQHRDRYLRHSRRPDGSFSLHAQGPPEDEGLLQAALRHGIEDRFRARTGDQPSPMSNGPTTRSLTYFATTSTKDLSPRATTRAAKSVTPGTDGIRGPATGPARSLVLRMRLINSRSVASARTATLTASRTLNWLQPTCAVSGCNSQIVQADHRIDWATTHHTTLAELDHLCPHHHRLKTHQGWMLTNGTGKRDLFPPTDPQHPNHQAHERAAA